MKGSGLVLKFLQLGRNPYTFSNLVILEFHRHRNVLPLTCKMIVETHEGKMGVESEESKGTTFFFSLPFEL
jgi:light-regulated signal transduction histidine kinase (bacteriophytochrome)